MPGSREPREISAVFTNLTKEQEMGLRIFFKNLEFLLKRNIRKDYVSNRDLMNFLGELPYMLPYDLAHTRIPQIKSPEETIAALTGSGKSIARFGDGEFMSMEETDIPFQKADPQLARRLREIFVSNDPNILIGAPGCIFRMPINLSPHCQIFLGLRGGNYRRQVLRFCDMEKTYYSTEFTQLYMTYENYDFDTYYQRIMKIWDQRDVTLICGKGILDGLRHNIFANAKSLDFIYAPSRDAFFEYDSILERARKISQDRMIIIILGPTATVLAYDLASEGYQALDFGHIAKDYNAWMEKQERSDQNISKFFKPD